MAACLPNSWNADSKLLGFSVVSEKTVTFPNGDVRTRWSMERDAGPLHAVADQTDPGTVAAISATAAAGTITEAVTSSLCSLSMAGAIGFAFGALAMRSTHG